MTELDWRALLGGRIVDLAHPWFRGMPVSPNQPPYQMALVKRHGDDVKPDGSSAASEILVLSGHVGTHIDALCHVSQDGLMHGGVKPAVATTGNGYPEMGMETVEPFFCRGVLLDVARVHSVEHLPAAYEITASDLSAAEELAGASVRAGDVALIHSGWSVLWDDPLAFGGQVDGTPGPGLEAAEWLAQRGVRAVGAETIGFEVIRPDAGLSLLPVHRRLLVEAGIHLFEVMDLSRLVASSAGEFLFVACPLKLVGATGSPTRPIAVLFD